MIHTGGTCVSRVDSGKQNGFTLFELIVFIIIASILASILLDRLNRYQEMAEKTVMEITVMNLRSGLRLQVAELMMQDKMGEAGNLLDQNPINWLEKVPAGYMGERRSVKLEDMPLGSWCYDRKMKELIYRPEHTRFFEPDKDGVPWVRYHIKAVSKPLQTGQSAQWEGLTLVLLSKYRWLE